MVFTNPFFLLLNNFKKLILTAKSGAYEKYLVALPIRDVKDCNASDSEKSWVNLKLCQGTLKIAMRRTVKRAG